MRRDNCPPSTPCGSATIFFSNWLMNQTYAKSIHIGHNGCQTKELDLYLFMQPHIATVIHFCDFNLWKSWWKINFFGYLRNFDANIICARSISNHNNNTNILKEQTYWQKQSDWSIQKYESTIWKKARKYWISISDPHKAQELYSCGHGFVFQAISWFLQVINRCIKSNNSPNF